MTAEQFVLDEVENPHPRMLAEALAARAVAAESPDDSTATNYWRGYLDAMCGATGCDEAEMLAWMDRNA